ncbi:AraC family transcriptional regulator [Gracilibacillus oryzae]|uniref:AraC family transcriptional regulator n=1 Tax=Gracilibacillus oryzae TaxID=1672701 RepID=A0A7C8L025_9BACI|nr:AraC family transcriptional regulator [Gracilibacillus oryzae]KAB8137796.1 AraC family transcriptional regulator [Gracilibacillus oryzae]
MGRVNISLRNQSFYLDYSRGYENTKDMDNYHLHQDYEIFYLLEGEKVFHVNGIEFIAAKGNLIFIDKNVLHKSSVKDRNFQRLVINFREEFIAETDCKLIEKLFKNGPTMIKMKNEQQLHYIFEKMLHEYHLNEERSEQYLRILLSQLLIESERSLQKIKETNAGVRLNKDFPVIDKIITHINEHFYKDINLSQLSHEFFLHEQYISKLFKQTTGCSFVEYLNAIRINEAKRLLVESKMKVAQIARNTGYANHVNFWRAFKRMTGVSPNEYREKNT